LSTNIEISPLPVPGGRTPPGPVSFATAAASTLPGLDRSFRAPLLCPALAASESVFEDSFEFLLGNHPARTYVQSFEKSGLSSSPERPIGNSSSLRCLVESSQLPSALHIFFRLFPIFVNPLRHVQNFSDMEHETCQSFGVLVKPTSRGPEKRRFQGQRQGDRLANWLESGAKQRPRARIGALVKSINRMRDLVLELRRQNISAEVAKVVDWHADDTSEKREKLRGDLVRRLQQRQSGWPPSDEAEDLYDLINEQLGFYVGGVLGLGTFDESGYAIFSLRVRGLSKAKDEEWEALDQLLWLSRKGFLHRVRKCDHVPCGRWFYARFDHQLSCSEKHRIAKYRSSPQFKEQKNQNQREYYRLHTDKNKNVVTKGGK
jgi:hypothetical protein